MKKKRNHTTRKRKNSNAIIPKLDSKRHRLLS